VFLFIAYGKGSETYIFPCKRWLAKDEDDGAIERELVADKVVDETVRKDGTSSKKELQRRNTLTGDSSTCCPNVDVDFAKRTCCNFV
jgi:hypothetical protein